MNKILIIGGGASGIMTALTAKNKDNEVTIIEKNKTLGQKLSITGGGRCNITNTNDRDEFFKNIISNSKFFYKAFYHFTKISKYAYSKAKKSKYNSKLKRKDDRYTYKRQKSHSNFYK